MPQHDRQIEMPGEEDASDDLIYHITHDLRAPVRALTLLPDWIQEDFDESGEAIPSVIGIHLDTIREQTKLLDQMILDLRDYSRVGRLADPFRDVNIEQLVEEIVPDLPATPELSLSLRLKHGVIHAPPNDLKILLKSLLSNCLQHHDCAQANVSLKCARYDDIIRLEIEDDGPGIAPEHRGRAFELMKTLYRRDEGAGSGVGLAIAKRVVENLNGSIMIAENSDGRGTSIQIVLPAEGTAPTATLSRQI